MNRFGVIRVARNLPDEFYPIPNQFNTSEEWEQFHHLDLKRLTENERMLEVERLRHRLLVDKNPSAWLLQRWRRLGEGKV